MRNGISAPLRKKLKALCGIAKEKSLRDNDVDFLLKVVRTCDNPEDKAAFLRLTGRIVKLSGRKGVEIEEALGELYSREAQKEARIPKSVCLGRWASRYGSSFVLDESKIKTLAQLMDVEDVDRKVANLIDLEAPIACPAVGELMVSIEGTWRESGIRVMREVAWRSLLAGNTSGTLEASADGWEFAAAVASGKSERLNNDDGVLVVEYSDGRRLIAVADGSGDSQMGYRASWRALECISGLLSTNLSLMQALSLASAQIRFDNRVNASDGMCTIAVALVLKDCVELCAVGDAAYGALCVDGLVSSSGNSLMHRCVLGGEPLGGTFTSSGNFVGGDFSNPGNCSVERGQFKRIVLASDGLRLCNRQGSSHVLDSLLSSESGPSEILRIGLENALGAFESGLRKPDDVSVAVVELGG